MAFPGRCDVTDMAKILDIRAGANTSLAIDMANDMVTEVCEPPLKSDGLTPVNSANRLKHIEIMLACHFYCIYDPRGQRERVGPLTFESQSKVDLGLNVTHYGQQAKILDLSGELAALEAAIADGRIPGKFTVTSKWLGKTYAEWPTWQATVENRD